MLADSGFWLALVNRRDPGHDRARTALETWVGERFASTWPVLTEACPLMSVIFSPTVEASKTLQESAAAGLSWRRAT